jgi:uncharacterized protein YuzE
VNGIYFYLYLTESNRVLEEEEEEEEIVVVVTTTTLS